MSEQKRPPMGEESSSFYSATHAALNAITSRDDEPSVLRSSAKEVKSSKLPGGGLYTTWEGTMPSDGVKRKPLGVSR
jgi:hypothetical protein